MKTRTIKELLIILRDNLDKYIGLNYLPTKCWGMCLIIDYLEGDEIISWAEKNTIQSYLRKNKPSNYYKRDDGFFFKKGSIPPRRRWLNKQIEKL